ILDYPGFTLHHAAEPTWWEWSAGWSRCNSFVILDMTLFDAPIAWGGSNIVGYCALDELLSMWHALRKSLPALWMHNDDCEMHSPESVARLMLQRSIER